MTTSLAWIPSQHISSWLPATWPEYLDQLEHPVSDQERVFFNLSTMWVDMGNEGINHARFNKLLTMVLFAWFSRQPQTKFDLLGGCTMEKPQTQGAAPDEVLYVT